MSGPAHHNSLQGLEELLKNLKRENFNLKLRIYFLEERIGINYNAEERNFINKNVELEVNNVFILSINTYNNVWLHPIYFVSLPTPLNSSSCSLSSATMFITVT